MLDERRAVRAAYEVLQGTTRRYLAETTARRDDNQPAPVLRNNAATRAAQQAWHRALARYASAFDDMARLALAPDYDVDERRSDAAEAGQVLEQVRKVHLTLRNDTPALGLDYSTEYAPSAQAYSFVQKLYAEQYPGDAVAMRVKYEELGLPVAGFPLSNEMKVAPGRNGAQASVSEAASSPARTAEAPSTQQFGVVLNGGGVKGLAFVGALLELYERTDARFTAFGGTSAGAIAATTLAMGYEVSRLETIFMRQSFASFLRSGWKPASTTPPWDLPAASEEGRPARAWTAKLMVLPRFLLGGALYSSAPIGRFVQYLNQWKPRADGTSRLRPNTKTDERLPDNLLVVASSTGQPNRVKLRGDRKLDFAIRATMAIPGFFEAMREGKDAYYDGGLVANFAFEDFAEEFPHHTPVGLYLYDGAANNRHGDTVPSPLNLLRHVFAIVQGQDEVEILEKHKTKIVRIDTSPIGTVDFALDADDKALLVASGRVAVLEFLLHEGRGTLPIAPEKMPTEEELAQRHAECEELRKAARARWAGPHRRQKLAVMASVALGAIAIVASIAIVTGAIFLLLLTPLPAPTCENGHLDGSETDVDCGGTDCPGCEDGSACRSSSDCVSGLCDPGTSRCLRAEAENHAGGSRPSSERTPTSAEAVDAGPQPSVDPTGAVTAECSEANCTAIRGNGNTVIHNPQSSDSP